MKGGRTEREKWGRDRRRKKGPQGVVPSLFVQEKAEEMIFVQRLAEKLILIQAWVEEIVQAGSTVFGQ